MVLICCLQEALLVDSFAPCYEFWQTGPVVLIYWLRGVMLIDRPCGAHFFAPGCYIDRPTPWCWFICSGFAILIDRPCGADLLSPGCYFGRQSSSLIWFWKTSPVVLIYWLWGVILIYRPCGAGFLAPGCHCDRLALWCWLVGSGVLFQMTGPVVLICWLRDVVLVDNLAHQYNFYRPALWCWFIDSGVLFWSPGPVVLICLFRGIILIDRSCGADMLAPRCCFGRQSCLLI